MNETKSINIIIDETNPTAPIFVEIENDKGESIRIGTRSEYHGLIKIRITELDLLSIGTK